MPHPPPSGSLAARRTHAEPFLLASVILWALVIVATLLFLIPRNNRIAAALPGPGQDSDWLPFTTNGTSSTAGASPL